MRRVRRPRSSAWRRTTICWTRARRSPACGWRVSVGDGWRATIQPVGDVPTVTDLMTPRWTNCSQRRRQRRPRPTRRTRDFPVGAARAHRERTRVLWLQRRERRVPTGLVRRSRGDLGHGGRRRDARSSQWSRCAMAKPSARVAAAAGNVYASSRVATPRSMPLGPTAFGRRSHWTSCCHIRSVRKI